MLKQRWASIARWKRNLATFVLVVLIGGPALSACYSGNSNGQKLAQVGDSITTLSTWDLNSTLGCSTCYDVNVNGENGQTLGGMYPELQTEMTDAEGAPNIVVVEGGSNDVLTGDTNYAFELYAYWLALQSTKCVVWVNVSTIIDQNVPGSSPTAEDINSAIQTMVSENPNFHYFDLNSLIQQGTNLTDYYYEDDDGFYVHPNPAGEQWIANQELAAVQQDCGS